MGDPLTATMEGTNDLSLLSALGSSFSAMLDLPELLRRVADATLELTGAAACQVQLIDPDTHHFSADGARATRAPDGQPMVVADDPVASYVIASQRPLLISPGDNLDRFGIEADLSAPRLYVPLLSRGRPLGLLVATADAPTLRFAQSQLDLLTGLGSYAASAIHNALLYKQALDRSVELGLLVESANAISSSLELGQVLNAISRYLMRVLQAHWCIISGWDAESSALRTMAEYRSAVWKPGAGPVFDPSLDRFAIHQQALLSAKPHSVCRAETPESAVLAALSCGRLLVIPVQVGGRPVGLAELYSVHQTGPFTPAQIGRCLRELLMVAPQLAMQKVGEEKTVDLRDAARSLLSATDTDFCRLYQQTGRGGQLAAVLAYGSGTGYEAMSPSISSHNLPTLRIVLREQRIAVLRQGDTALHPLERMLFSETGPAAMLALPLVFRDATVGLVQLYDLNPERIFNPREMGLARALGNQAAVALENAHLVRDLQRSLAEIQAMQGHLVRAARLSALGEVSAVVAHQVNNPLTTILGDAELLVEDLPPALPQHASAQAILRAGRRAKEVVERILMMARGQDRSSLDSVNRTIREVIDLIGPQLAQHSITLECSLASDLPPINMNASQLEDVWMNLLLNARDALLEQPDGQGHVWLSTSLSTEGDAVVVVVRDDGPGIAPEHLGRVFDPFFTTKPHGQGTGLGLYICRQIISDHGGEIAVSSAAGTGTTVAVRLPTVINQPETVAWQAS